MGKYLVLANQTATSVDLAHGLLETAREDPAAQFVLVVPATPVEHLLVPEEGDPQQIAARRAGLALTRLTDAGVPIAGAHIGGTSLIVAIDDAIRESASEYAGIIVSTLPQGLSRWYEPDMVDRIQAAFHLPVRHIVAQAPPGAGG